MFVLSLAARLTLRYYTCYSDQINVMLYCFSSWRGSCILFNSQIEKKKCLPVSKNNTELSGRYLLLKKHDGLKISTSMETTNYYLFRTAVSAHHPLLRCRCIESSKSCCYTVSIRFDTMAFLYIGLTPQCRKRYSYSSGHNCDSAVCHSLTVQ